MTAIPSSFQLRVHRDLGVEDFGNRTAFLGVLGGFFEFGLVAPGDLDVYLQMYGRDGESGVDLFQRHRGCGVNGLRGHAGGAELRGESHAETSRMGGSDQFLRIGARLRLEASRKRIRSVLEDSAGRGERPFTVLEAAGPMRACVSFHESLLLCVLRCSHCIGRLIRHARSSLPDSNSDRAFRQTFIAIVMNPRNRYCVTSDETDPLPIDGNWRK